MAKAKEKTFGKRENVSKGLTFSHRKLSGTYRPALKK